MSTRTPRKFVGGYRPDGLPHAHLEAYGIPARDLSGDELDALTSDQLKIADDSGLYEMARTPTKSAAKAKPKATPAPTAEPDPIAPDADPASIETPAEPAQEGEG